MLNNIPMDKVILRKWGRGRRPTVPFAKRNTQRAIISPTLANIMLDGLERVVRKEVPPSVTC